MPVAKPSLARITSGALAAEIRLALGEDLDRLVAEEVEHDRQRSPRRRHGADRARRRRAGRGGGRGRRRCHRAHRARSGGAAGAPLGGAARAYAPSPAGSAGAAAARSSSASAEVAASGPSTSTCLSAASAASERPRAGELAGREGDRVEILVLQQLVEVARPGSGRPVADARQPAAPHRTPSARSPAAARRTPARAGAETRGAADDADSYGCPHRRPPARIWELLLESGNRLACSPHAVKHAACITGRVTPFGSDSRSHPPTSALQMSRTRRSISVGFVVLVGNGRSQHRPRESASLRWTADRKAAQHGRKLTRRARTECLWRTSRPFGARSAATTRKPYPERPRWTSAVTRAVSC